MNVVHEHLILMIKLYAFIFCVIKSIILCFLLLSYLWLLLGPNQRYCNFDPPSHKVEIVIWASHFLAFSGLKAYDSFAFVDLYISHGPTFPKEVSYMNFRCFIWDIFNINFIAFLFSFSLFSLFWRIFLF
jgi:hypothetical protein